MYGAYKSSATGNPINATTFLNLLYGAYTHQQTVPENRKSSQISDISRNCCTKKAYPTIKVLYKFCIKVVNVVGAFTSFLQDQSKASVRGYAFPKRDGYERSLSLMGHCRSYRHSVSKTKLPRFPIPYTNGQTDRQRGRQAGRQAGRQTNRQAERQTDR